MSLASSLPPELLCRIFILASDHPPSLARAALVCQSWTDPAQRALHTHVRLRTSTQADGWLASPTRLQYPIQSMFLVREEGQADDSRAVRVLLACTGVEELVLVCQTWAKCGFLALRSLSRQYCLR